MLTVVPVTQPAGRPMDSINMYLILNDPITLVDAGFHTPGFRDALHEALQQNHLDETAIQRVIITHTHPDHVGLAKELEDSAGAAIFMHPLEWKKIHSGLSDNIHLYHWAGIPQSYRAISHPSHNEPPLDFKTYEPLAHGVTIPFSNHELQVIHTPGHSSGQICLFEPFEKILFTSDHLVPNFSPALLVEPGNAGLNDRTESLAQYRQSLKILLPVEIERAYPGHGLPFDQVHTMIHHKLNRSIPDKLSRVAGCLSDTPQTVYEIVSRMIPELPPALAFFACGDTLAYLDYLAAQNQAESVVTDDKILFSSTRQ